MKRLLTILAGVVLAATLAACGSSGSSGGTDGSFTPMPTTDLSGGTGASASPTTAP